MCVGLGPGTILVAIVLELVAAVVGRRSDAMLSSSLLAMAVASSKETRLRKSIVS